MKSSISKALRDIVAERDGYACVLCDAPYADIHHVIPRSRGGRDNPRNLVALCRIHHEIVHGNGQFVGVNNSYMACWLSDENFDRWRASGVHAATWAQDAFQQRIIEYLCDYYASQDSLDAYYQLLLELCEADYRNALD